MKYMLSKKDSSDNIETLKLDFCSKYSESLPKRTQFVIELRAASDSDFNFKCMSALQADTDGLNSWFSPIDPMASIS